MLPGAGEQLSSAPAKGGAVFNTRFAGGIAAPPRGFKFPSEVFTQRTAPHGQEYVDPYLFETGHFASRAEYDELTRTAEIKPRARA